MNKTWKNTAIGLAGVLQAADMVEELAKSGYLNTRDFETCIESLFQQSPPTVESVYGGVAPLRRGLKTLYSILQDHKNAKHVDLLRYALGLFHLQKKLSRQPEMLQIIGSRLERASQQARHFGATHDNVIANLADIYTDTLSKFRFRIQVTGDYNYLQQQRVANQIRALLLAGIRAAILWRQTGGSRWQLIFQRGKILEATQALLREVGDAP